MKTRTPHPNRNSLSSQEPSFTYLRINESLEQITGLENDSVVGHGPEDIFEPEVTRDILNHYRKCVREQTEQHYVEEVDLPHGSGTWKTVLKPLLRNGRVEAIQGVTQDVTDEISNRKELQFFREAINQHEDEFYFVEPETGRFTGATESVEDLLGYTKQELLSLNVQDVYPRIGNTLTWDEHMEKLKREGPLKYEVACQRKDGSLFASEILVDYVVVEKTHRALIAARDITEWKQKEQQLKERELVMEMIHQDPFKQVMN